MQVMQLSLRCHRAVAATCTGRGLSHCPLERVTRQRCEANSLLRSHGTSVKRHALRQQRVVVQSPRPVMEQATGAGAGRRWPPVGGQAGVLQSNTRTPTLRTRCRLAAGAARADQRAALRDSACRMLEPAARRAR